VRISVKNTAGEIWATRVDRAGFFIFFVWPTIVQSHLFSFVYIQYKISMQITRQKLKGPIYGPNSQLNGILNKNVLLKLQWYYHYLRE
jgi:hypothetical protein